MVYKKLPELKKPDSIMIRALPSSWHLSCCIFPLTSMSLHPKSPTGQLLAPEMQILCPWTCHVVSVLYTFVRAAFSEVPLKHTCARTHSDTMWLITL